MEDINVSVYIEDMSEGNDYKYSLEEKIKRREMDIDRAKTKLEILENGKNKDREEEI